MIVAEQKPLAEIKTMIAHAERVLVVGCGTCVTVCFAGGTKEVDILASSLRMSTKLDGNGKVVDELTVQRQCEWEYNEPLKEKLADYDVVLSLGCGVGVQTLTEQFPEKRFIPGLNTKFMGLPTEQGVCLQASREAQPLAVGRPEQRFAMLRLRHRTGIEGIQGTDPDAPLIDVGNHGAVGADDNGPQRAPVPANSASRRWVSSRASHAAAAVVNGKTSCPAPRSMSVMI